MNADIIHLALVQLKQETGITAEFLEEGMLQIKGEGKPIQFVVVQKEEPRNYQLAAYMALKEQHPHVMVIARQLFPGIREQLYANNIAYLDALGNIPLVLEGLKETGHLIPLNKKEYLWENRQELLQRWVENYTTTLKPRLHKGRHRLTLPWQEIRLDNTQTVWGGEPAADILTRHLRPEKYILYTQETTDQLMKNYRLIPHKEGELEVLERFWPQNQGEATAPSLIIYADLLAEGGKRNLETAQIVYNEHIQPNL